MFVVRSVISSVQAYDTFSPLLNAQNNPSVILCRSVRLSFKVICFQKTWFLKTRFGVLWLFGRIPHYVLVEYFTFTIRS